MTMVNNDDDDDGGGCGGALSTCINLYIKLNNGDDDELDFDSA